MKKLGTIYITFAVLLVMSLIAGQANAGPVDLTSWSELTLNYPGGQSSGNWILGGGKNDDGLMVLRYLHLAFRFIITDKRE